MSAKQIKVPIQAGDTVRFKDDDTRGTVQAVKGEKAQVFWIGFRLGPNYDGWQPMSELRRLPKKRASK